MNQMPAMDMECEWRLQRLEKLARLMDARWKVMGVPLGLDALIGLVPVVGDAVGLGVGFYMLWQAWRMGAPASLLLRMLLNYLIDAVVGAMPLVGDLLDVALRAHQRNAALLTAHFRPQSVPPRRRLWSGSFQWLALLMVCALAWLLWLVLRPWVLHFS